MARTVRQKKYWLIGVFVLVMVLGISICRERIYAQNSDIPVEKPPPGWDASTNSVSPTGVTDPSGATSSGAAVTSPVPTEPEISFGQIAHGNITASAKKSWDGTVFRSLKFKYKTVDGRTLTVVMPAEYKNEKKTRASWETLFVVYAMDIEIVIDTIEKNMPPDVSAFMSQLMAEIRGRVSNRPAPEIISEAFEKAKAYLPAMGMGNMSMPPSLPGMP